ncbi:hypothetical protein ACLMJK_000973 [Lecanora helva]
MGQLGDLSPQGSVAVGIFVGLVSTSVQSLGLTLQRKSHLLEDEKDPHDVRRPPYRRRRWQIGMLMFIISNLAGSTIQITTLPLPVLSTLQASGLVFNSICATLILREPFTRWSFGGTVLVCAGAVLIAIFGAIAEPAHNLDQLLSLLERRQFIVWMVAQAILVIAIVASAKSLKYLSLWTSNSPRMRLFRGMAYGAVSGILSAHSLLVAKSAVELLVRTIVDRHNEFNRWESWIILLSLLALALTQLYYLHRGLKLCSTSILYPFVFCVYNIIAILDGLIYFDQSSRLSLLHALLIALGTVILLLGVFALSWRLHDDPATRPPVSQNPLTPGMGFVDDENDSTLGTDATVSESDEEALLPNGQGQAGVSNLPRYDYSSFNDPQSPDVKANHLLKVARLRNHGITESEEIWEELEDDSISPPSPGQPRRCSAHSLLSPKPGLRYKSMNAATPDESTSLLARSGTGRSYRNRRASRPLSQGHEHEGRRRSTSSQNALGGWWKMKRWWKGTNQRGNGCGDDNGANGDGTP